MSQKKSFETIFIFLVFLLLALPFLLAFNDVLTKFVEKFVLWRLLQRFVVPLQTQIVGIVVSPFVGSYEAFADGMLVDGIPIKMSWNCLGWQSLVLFAISIVVALRDSSYTLFSKCEALILGFLGIFWINILRISFTVVLARYFEDVFRIVFHDYLAAITTAVFLVFFWWFAYAFI